MPQYYCLGSRMFPEERRLQASSRVRCFSSILRWRFSAKLRGTADSEPVGRFGRELGLSNHWTLGNTVMIMGSTWHWICHFVYQF